MKPGVCPERWRGFATDDGGASPCCRPLGHDGPHGPEQPHDHDHCPCVERLRAQNKASSDEWTRRTAEMQSELYGLRSLMHEALVMHRKGHVGLSAYGQAALAAALDLADAAEAKVEALEEQVHRERRLRIATERDLAATKKSLSDNSPKCPRCGFGRAAAPAFGETGDTQPRPGAG